VNRIAAAIALLLCIATLAPSAPLAAAPPAPPVIPDYQIESVRFRYTRFEQAGLGYQSAAGPSGAPGSQQLTVEEPQAEITARIGDRVTERLWVPVDVVTAASPDHSRFDKPYDAPLDAVTHASRINTAASFDSLSTYRWDRTTDVALHVAFHVEEPLQSWAIGIGWRRSFAEENTSLAASLNQVMDWFDRFDLAGQRHGRAARSTSNVNLSLTQVLSPTTIVDLSYGGTWQEGTLSNTWSSVLLSDGTRGEERLPRERLRHALAARLAQWLPWEGALKLRYRAYVDGWGIRAHTGEADLVQRLFGVVQLRATYRRHKQTEARFFTTSGDPASTDLRTADSDLGAFVAQTVGGGISLDLARAGPAGPFWRDLHVDIGYERYFRSDHLTIDVTTWGLGFRF
jgi:hypothetical protein